uniref:Uncharacterized protein n=1 Tax=Rhizophagus irregularis (strain DAOM 181602 / DAOM 197198 / MUCL 43194) TaxID=747089 RepID=U9SFJ1_RHIID
MAMNNSSLLPINHQITYGDIDWIYTKQWINSNPFDMPTSSKLSKIQSNRLKKSTFTYPTGNILQRNYPNLYPLGRIHCTECSIDEDTNAHIGLCPSHRQSITPPRRLRRGSSTGYYRSLMYPTRTTLDFIITPPHPSGFSCIF